MSRRIDIELTSKTDDAWTWRAAGAREPKGVVPASLVPEGASVGDELRVEAEFFVDGIEVVAVLPPKAERKQPETLEILGSGRDQGGVTTQLVPKGARGRGGRRGDRDGGRRRDGRGEGRGDNRGDRQGRERRPRSDSRPERPAPPAKPKPKRLRPRRAHRDAAMNALPEEQRPIADQVLRGGLPGVRKAIEEQNARNKAEGRPEIDATPLVQLAESLLPKLKEAEWHDRAEAALAGIDEIDLRDLRSVVVAADSAARSDETRALAVQIQEAVAARVDRDQAQWLADITEALDDERTVRALRMSSRPPKAGAPLPPDVANRLVDAANASLTDETGPQRWGTVLDAVAYAPIRQSVTPQGIPGRPNDELLETVKRLSSRVPQIAALFGIEPQDPPRKRRRSRGGGRGGGGRGPADQATAKRTDAGQAPSERTVAEQATTDDAPVDESVVEPEAVAPDASVSEAAEAAEAVVEAAAVAPDASVSEAPEGVEAAAADEPAGEGVEAAAADEPASEAVEAAAPDASASEGVAADEPANEVADAG